MIQENIIFKEEIIYKKSFVKLHTMANLHIAKEISCLPSIFFYLKFYMNFIKILNLSPSP